MIGEKVKDLDRKEKRKNLKKIVLVRKIERRIKIRIKRKGEEDQNLLLLIIQMINKEVEKKRDPKKKMIKNELICLKFVF